MIGLYFARRRSFRDTLTIIHCAWIGMNLALVINYAAIGLGLESYRVSDGTQRSGGLYSDAGVLGLIAAQSFCLCIYLPALQSVSSQRIPKWMIYGSMLLSILFVGVTVSRAALALVSISLAVYFLVFARAGNFSQAVLVFIVSAGVLAYTIIQGEFSQRLVAESEILREGVREEASFESGDVHLGDFRRLGSNRGMVIESGINEFLDYSGQNRVFGRFTSRSTHCDYLDILRRFGLVGLCIYMSLLFRALYDVVKKLKVSRTRNVRALVCLAASFLLMYMFYSIPFRPIWYTTNSWYVWLLIGLVIAMSSPRRGLVVR